MKKLALTTIILSSLLFASCNKDQEAIQANDNFNKRSTAADYAGYPSTVQTVSGSISSNTTWTNDKVWELSGVVTVNAGATLTIQPGTYIKSTVNTLGTPNGVLAILKGAKINAVGTATSPIVFTSRYLLDGDASTKGTPGDFGGVILLGDAPVNVAGQTIEGLPTSQEYVFGGNNAADNSGSLKYVRIEYGGYNLSPDNEVNGLTLGGVGNGTLLDYIQISYGKDDGFEFFGGTVNGTHLIAFGSDDDQFDFDNGYSGTIQYAIAVADGNSSHSGTPGNSDSNGIESDNNAPDVDPTFSLLPKTRPTLRNFTIVGTRTTAEATGIGYKYGVRNRRGAEIDMQASLITGYPSGFVFDETDASASILRNNSVHGFNAAIVPFVAGNTVNTGATAADYDMESPWFNANPNLNFLASGPRGAVTSVSGNWTNVWTKFIF